MAGELARAVLARVQAAVRAPAPRSSPPWKWGTRPRAARSSVDLPEPDPPTQQHQLARLDVEVDAVQGRAGRRPGRGRRRARSSARPSHHRRGRGQKRRERARAGDRDRLQRVAERVVVAEGGRAADQRGRHEREGARADGGERPLPAPSSAARVRASVPARRSRAPPSPRPPTSDRSSELASSGPSRPAAVRGALIRAARVRAAGDDPGRVALQGGQHAGGERGDHRRPRRDPGDGAQQEVGVGQAHERRHGQRGRRHAACRRRRRRPPPRR